MSEPLRIALAGLGTVGGGVIRLLEANAALIARRAGRPITITAISARNRTKDRGVDLSGYAWEDDMVILGERPDVDVVVELVGGADGPALALARTTFEAGKALVTANKAMIAHHGLELATKSEAAKVAFKFEAAVAGGIPVIKALKEGAAANHIDRVYGILNGTCNYILSTMEDTGRDFADVLAEAQAKGYAESDPTFDIDGIDAAHKLAILSSIAFGTAVDFKPVAATGIRRVIAADIAQADALGYYIRLIGMAETAVDEAGQRRLFQRVHPMLVHRDHPLAHVDGATNAVVAEGNFVGRLLFQGAGAGDGPTASAVVADLIDIARGDIGAPFSIPAVIAVVPAPGCSEEEILRFAAAVERASEHPLALAIVAAAKQRSIAVPDVSAFDSPKGRGALGTVEGRRIVLGNARFLGEQGVDTDALAAPADDLRRDGATAIFVGIDGAAAGVIAIADPVKQTTPEALAAIRAEGMRVVMLTGDNRTTAQAVADRLGIAEVEAEVLPDQKSDIVARLRREGRIVAMAGDGVNDAPALAAADVGIAMGTGTDVAIESAAVTLLKGDLNGIVRARRLSQATMANIRQNLLFAFVYNAAGVPIAAGLLYPWFGILLSPKIAAATMALSSVSLVSNALRLGRRAL